MGIFDKLFGKKKSSKTPDMEHSVIVHFSYHKDDLEPLHDLEDKLEEVLNDCNVGELDGHEIAMDMSDGFLHLYGPNAEDLFKAVKQTLEQTDFTHGAKATLRFGGPDSEAREIVIEVGK